MNGAALYLVIADTHLEQTIGLTLLGAHALHGDRADLPVLHFGLAGVALVGQLLARPSSARG